MFGRIERRSEWARSWVGLFQKINQQNYQKVGDTLYTLEDPCVQKIGDEYYDGNKKLNKDLVESKKLKFDEMKEATIEEMYKFLKNLTDRDIELYHQRMIQALNNIDKVQEQRMLKVSQEANKRKEQEDYVRNFIENNGFGRNRRR